VTAATYRLSTDFVPACNRLDATDSHRVWQAVERFGTNPGHPGLNLEKLVDADGLWSIRASHSLRVILLRDDPTWIFVDAGQHDEVYERVARRRLVVEPNTGLIALVPDPRRLPADGPRPPVITISGPTIESTRRLFDHWADSDLLEAEFDETSIALLRRCIELDDLFEVGLAKLALERAFDLIEKTPEEWRAPILLAAEDGLNGRLKRAIANFGVAHGLSQLLTAEELTKLARAPIEEWMIFLHPDQRSIIERRFDGPARIRGAAGTGKTAVALHRAAELARRFAVEEPDAPPILFTTFIKTLPPVFEDLYSRLPTARTGAVSFVNVDKYARRTVNEAGHEVRTDTSDINAAFRKAKERIVSPGSPLAASRLTDSYLKDEITKVIKGRGIDSLDDYLEIERTGRVVPFNRILRQQIWALRVAWDEEMASRGTLDFSDVMRLARDIARSEPSPRFRAAIVDEAQDLTLVGLQFVQALVSAGASTVPSDGLLLVGDGAQRIYPGCYTLRQAGIEVAGRSTILKTNYRNTAEILAAAMAVAGDLDVDDLGDEFRRGDADVTSLRSSGHRPIVATHQDATAEQAFVLDRLRHHVDHDGIALGDIGIFLPTNPLAKDFLGLLRTADIPGINLDQFDGRVRNAVKVGTYHRAKGLEVKVVMLPSLDERFPRPAMPGQDPIEYSEERDLWISALFVAMTRARDELIIACAGGPSSLIIENLDFFDLVEY